MEPLQIPTEEEIRAALWEGGEAAVIFFMEHTASWMAVIQQLQERVEKLENQLARNSSNSGKPPSSDGLKKAKRTRSLRKRSGKKSGGQQGHPGKTLEMRPEPEYEVLHQVTACRHCEADLSDEAPRNIERRQVFDLPPVQVEVTEHQAEVKVCPYCKCENRAEFPPEASQPVQYGPGFNAQLVYFNQYHFVSLSRVAEVMVELYGQAVSEATIVTACQKAAEGVVGVNQQTKQYLTEQADVSHHDETGMRVNQKLAWLHVSSTAHLTSLEMHPKRGSIALLALDVLANRRGVVVHDDYASYFQFKNVAHALCNAHHLRTLKFIEKRRVTIVNMSS